MGAIPGLVIGRGWSRSIAGRQPLPPLDVRRCSCQDASLATTVTAVAQENLPVDATPKLTVEIIPTSLHGKNPRTAMAR
jgi:hypothetical protein